MAQKYLGPLFDIHTGGEDHVPVHHTNEIAQTAARCGTRLANYWLHGAFLQIARGKMSKSDGGFLRLATVIERGYDPLAYRYLCQTAHYRSSLEFAWEHLDAAAVALERLRAGVRALDGEPSHEADADAIGRFTRVVNRDLDLPGAIALAWSVLKSDLPRGVKRATLIAFDRVMAIGLDSAPRGEIELRMQSWRSRQRERERDRLGTGPRRIDCGRRSRTPATSWRTGPIARSSFVDAGDPRRHDPTLNRAKESEHDLRTQHPTSRFAKFATRTPPVRRARRMTR
jgi:cysteinyl-tRNA synthetase